jgi:hypothetical protein
MLVRERVASSEADPWRDSPVPEQVNLSSVSPAAEKKNGILPLAP